MLLFPVGTGSGDVTTAGFLSVIIAVAVACAPINIGGMVGMPNRLSPFVDVYVSPSDEKRTRELSIVENAVKLGTMGTTAGLQ